ncbi:SIS domain-containing protein [Alteromonas sp. SM 2104]|nr:SIS domain-containing protein [Alteromonas oceanisediminis]
MAIEARQSADVIETQLRQNQALFDTLCEELRESPPRTIMMIGRGTSDHAGVFAKYLFEVGCGIPVIAAAPSVAGVFNSTLKLDGCLAIAVSQSGKSPDILHQTRLAKQGGAYTVALVNDTSSPLAELVDQVVPLHAGEEKAVAATKSYLATLSSLCQLYAMWQQDGTLQDALALLPSTLRTVQQQAARLLSDDLAGVTHCVVLGRGFGYAIAREVALKLKEVLGIHAEAFSSAEFLHGPVTLVHKKLCVLNIAVDDESLSSHNDQIVNVAQRGGKVLSMSVDKELHPRLHPLLIMQRFYLDIEHIAIARGLDPDEPVGLKKVTETR